MGLTRLAGDWLQRQGHLRFRGHRKRLGVRVEGRDHHVGHVHLLGPWRTKNTSASCLLPQSARLGSKLNTFNSNSKAECMEAVKCVQGSPPGSAAGAGWSCAAAVLAAAAAWQSETKERGMCVFIKCLHIAEPSVYNVRTVKMLRIHTEK